MGQAPFFSIVIPTKNRPEYLRDTIQSVLWQDFQDYELIVSDNWNDERTKRVVDEFSNDARLKYVRPDRELNMPDHWEFASKYAKGNYVFMLTDRSLFRNGALRNIAETIASRSAGDIKVLSWPHNIFERGLLRETVVATTRVVVSDSKDLLSQYAREGRVDPRFPLLPNACYHRELAARIRGKHGRLFFPIAPDNTSDFLFLSYANKVVNLGVPQVLAQQIANSNGALALIKGPESYFNTLNMTRLYRYVPIHAPLIQSLNFDDFLSIRAMVGMDPPDSGVRWANYFLRSYGEIVYFSRNGYIKHRKKEFMDAWRTALSTFESAVRDEVRSKMFSITMKFSLKAWLAQNPLTSVFRSVQNLLQYRSFPKKYPTALAAAGFEKNSTAAYKKGV